MKDDVILIFKDGRKQEAALTSPFSPQENTIDVFLYDGTGQHTFPFEDLCYIGIMSTPAPHD